MSQHEQDSAHHRGKLTPITVPRDVLHEKETVDNTLAPLRSLMAGVVVEDA